MIHFFWINKDDDWDLVLRWGIFTLKKSLYINFYNSNIKCLYYCLVICYLFDKKITHETMNNQFPIEFNKKLCSVENRISWSLKTKFTLIKIWPSWSPVDAVIWRCPTNERTAFWRKSVEDSCRNIGRPPLVLPVVRAATSVSGLSWDQDRLWAGASVACQSWGIAVKVQIQ